MECRFLKKAYITPLALAAFFLVACSNDSGTGTGVDHGEINIPIGPSLESSADVAPESSTAAEPLSSTEEMPTSSAAQAPSSSVAQAPSSSAVDDPESSATEESPSSSTTSVADSSDSAVPESDSGSWRETCLDIINEYRATEGAAPLTLADDDKQACTDEQAALDLASGQAHGNFGYCKEFAQNTGPNFSLKWKNDIEDIAKYYLDMMWDEKELIESGERNPNSDEDYPYIGHYLNMRNTRYTKVSCGFAINEETQKGWFNVDFY